MSEASGAEGDEEAPPASMPGSVSRRQSRAGAGGSNGLAAELSAGTLWAVHATAGTAPQQSQLQPEKPTNEGTSSRRAPLVGPTTGGGLRLLTPQQFQVSLVVVPA